MGYQLQFKKKVLKNTETRITENALQFGKWVKNKYYFVEEI